MRGCLRKYFSGQIMCVFKGYFKRTLEIDGETVETVSDFIFWGSKITADGDHSHEIKRCLLLGRKVMANLDSIFKSRDITLPTKVCLVKANPNPLQCSCLENPREGGAWWVAVYGVAQSRTRLKWLSGSSSSQDYGFSSSHVWMWELDCEESWVPKNWCFWTVALEKTLESPLDCKKIQPVYSKGDQSWVFFGRNDAKAETPVLWPPHTKSWLIGKDSDAGRD